jgi:hypothetical protein
MPVAQPVLSASHRGHSFVFLLQLRAVQEFSKFLAIFFERKWLLHCDAGTFFLSGVGQQPVANPDLLARRQQLGIAGAVAFQICTIARAQVLPEVRCSGAWFMIAASLTSHPPASISARVSAG